MAVRAVQHIVSPQLRDAGEVGEFVDQAGSQDEATGRDDLAGGQPQGEVVDGAGRVDDEKISEQLAGVGEGLQQAA